MRRSRLLAPADAMALHGRDDVVFVDIRDPRELEREGRMPGSIHCPRGMLEFWIDPESPYHKPVFAEDKRFVFFCAGGWRSARRGSRTGDGIEAGGASRRGFGAWKEAGGPVETVEEAAQRRLRLHQARDALHGAPQLEAARSRAFDRRGLSSAVSTLSTRAPAGPRRQAARTASTSSVGLESTASTAPSRRFRTQPSSRRSSA